MGNGFVHEERGEGMAMIGLTVSGKVCLAWDTNGSGVGDVVDGIRGSTTSCAGSDLESYAHICEAYPLSQLACGNVHGEHKDGREDEKGRLASWFPGATM